MSLSVLLRSLPTTYTPSSLKTLEPASLFACLSLLDSPPATPYSSISEQSSPCLLLSSLKLGKIWGGG